VINQKGGFTHGQAHDYRGQKIQSQQPFNDCCARDFTGCIKAFFEGVMDLLDIEFGCSHKGTLSATQSIENCDAIMERQSDRMG
jgi:hypothetical protein